MKVGDYVRTENYGIKKILDIGEYVGMKQYLINEEGNYVIDNSIIKSSPNIIDLIEVGDYVNGKKVVDKWEEPGWFGYFIKLEGEKTVPTIRKIKSIVTKEQFESKEYKIGE